MKIYYFLLVVIISFSTGCKKLSDEEKFEKDLCKIYWTNIGGSTPSENETLGFYIDNKVQFNFHSSKYAEWHFYKENGTGKLKISFDDYVMTSWDNNTWNPYSFDNLIFGYIYRNNPTIFTVQQFISGDDENANQKSNSLSNASLLISTDSIAFQLNYAPMDSKNNNSKLF